MTFRLKTTQADFESQEKLGNQFFTVQIKNL